MKPLCIDIFCGVGGWTAGFLAEGWDCIGFDIERHVYGAERYPAQLVLQDALTIHGSQLKDADCIVCSPPCNEYSWMAMPWTRAKAKAAAIRADTSGKMLADLNRLFEACFRIQREACEAAGHHIPLIVENVRGAQPWVGRARWMFGSFALWGDVPALMPSVGVRKLAPHLHLGGGNSFIAHGREAARHDSRHAERRTQEVAAHNPRLREGFKSAGMNWSDPTLRGQDFTRIAGGQQAAIQGKGGWFGEYKPGQPGRSTSSGSPRRKAASAMIAKIPEPLARHVARVFRP